MPEFGEPLADTRDMYMVHTMFRREFGLLPGLVRGVADGDRERAKVVAGHLELVTTILEHHHHGEDTHLWPRLVERSFSESSSVVDTMGSQHANIDKLDVQVAAVADAWRETASAADGRVLAESLDELAAAINEHMATEEALALPLLRRYITAAEWHGMVDEARAGMSPETLVLGFGLLMYEGDRDVIEEVMDSMPDEVRPVIKPMAAQAFAAHAELVHGTATPRRSTEL